MEKRKPVNRDDFSPLVAYIKDYLRKEKPARDATKIQKDRYAEALKCVRELEGLLKDGIVVTGRYELYHNCGIRYPIVPPVMIRLLK